MPTNVPGACKVKTYSGAMKSTSVPDTELGNNLEALYDAYRKNYSDLIGYSYMIVRSEDVAQDVVQQAFTNTLSTIEGGSQIGTMGGFIYRCVHNLSMNYVGRERKHASIEDSPPPIEQSAAATAEARGRWQRVQDTLDTLPPNQRYVFLLAEVRGLHYDEIADALGRSTSAVRQLLNRARGKVRAKADIGSDWIGTSVPAMGADRVLGSWHRPLGSNVSGWVRPRISELHTWLGSVSQTFTDATLQSSYSIAAGLTIVALAAVSPAPPAQQGINNEAPAAGNTIDSVPLVSRPHSYSAPARIDEYKPSPRVTTPPPDAADLSGVVPIKESPSDRGNVATAVKVDRDDTKTNVVREPDTDQTPNPGDEGVSDPIDPSDAPGGGQGPPTLCQGCPLPDEKYSQTASSTSPAEEHPVSVSQDDKTDLSMNGDQESSNGMGGQTSPQGDQDSGSDGQPD